MTGSQADRCTGILGILFSATYVAYAQRIEDSLLADAVGAAGVPSGIGLLLMLASAGLALKSFAKGSSPASSASSAAATDDPAEPASPWRPHQLALGLLALLALYVLVLPLAGYWLSIALLIAGVSALAGARAPGVMAACGVLGASTLYALFTLLLKIRMPAGLWPAWMGA